MVLQITIKNAIESCWNTNEWSNGTQWYSMVFKDIQWYSMVYHLLFFVRATIAVGYMD